MRSLPTLPPSNESKKSQASCSICHAEPWYDSRREPCRPAAPSIGWPWMDSTNFTFGVLVADDCSWWSKVEFLHFLFLRAGSRSEWLPHSLSLTHSFSGSVILQLRNQAIKNALKGRTDEQTSERARISNEHLRTKLGEPRKKREGEVESLNTKLYATMMMMMLVALI